MTAGQRAGIALYFRNYAMLVDASRFLSGRARGGGAYRWLLWVVNATLLRRFYRATSLSAAEVEALVDGAGSIFQARCVCAPRTAAPATCFYLGEAGSAYRRHGPLPLGEVDVPATLAALRQPAEGSPANTWYMTVVGPSACAVFPRRYVVCRCDRTHCLVSGFDTFFPNLGIVQGPSNGSAPPARAAADHLIAALFGIPAFVLWIALYLRHQKGPVLRIVLDTSVLLFLAFVAGSIISCPAMWPFLHWPTWPHNAHFGVLLPLGAVLEATLLTMAGEMGRRVLRRSGSFVTVLCVVLPALVLFELVHLLRFASVWLLLGALGERVCRTIFWAWDPIAYAALGWSLVVGARGKVLPSPRPART